uniref:Uncharacterized protein n=1 Tax=Chromera velia CCMP2878 TaxID=1169474 RepID=A0A0G4FEV9_9ALVE|eukprot:Cvel_3274.t1-p1 / transcript=Cvel_3274.t1 / gene=Cvel_3274 / organism=Chromera_velia_CCMP2878 / gene_product=hypothetical protein / transcript_product=hypothetical protein / location=Cvel_scaffold128:115264-126831(+) / protein_length=980 / sequence_SO=supercontig / SO=protein_coding / is_pseudo=false
MAPQVTGGDGVNSGSRLSFRAFVCDAVCADEPFEVATENWEKHTPSAVMTASVMSKGSSCLGGGRRGFGEPGSAVWGAGAVCRDLIFSVKTERSSVVLQPPPSAPLFALVSRLQTPLVDSSERERARGLLTVRADGLQIEGKTDALELNDALIFAFPRQKVPSGDSSQLDRDREKGDGGAGETASDSRSFGSALSPSEFTDQQQDRDRERDRERERDLLTGSGRTEGGSRGSRAGQTQTQAEGGAREREGLLAAVVKAGAAASREAPGLHRFLLEKHFGGEAAAVGRGGGERDSSKRGLLKALGELLELEGDDGLALRDAAERERMRSEGTTKDEEGDSTKPKGSEAFPPLQLDQMRDENDRNLGLLLECRQIGSATQQMKQRGQRRAEAARALEINLKSRWRRLGSSRDSVFGLLEEASRRHTELSAQFPQLATELEVFRLPPVAKEILRRRGRDAGASADTLADFVPLYRISGFSASVGDDIKRLSTALQGWNSGLVPLESRLEAVLGELSQWGRGFEGFGISEVAGSESVDVGGAAGGRSSFIDLFVGALQGAQESAEEGAVRAAWALKGYLGACGGRAEGKRRGGTGEEEQCERDKKNFEASDQKEGVAASRGSGTGRKKEVEEGTQVGEGKVLSPERREGGIEGEREAGHSSPSSENVHGSNSSSGGVAVGGQEGEGGGATGADEETKVAKLREGYEFAKRAAEHFVDVLLEWEKLQQVFLKHLKDVASIQMDIRRVSEKGLLLQESVRKVSEDIAHLDHVPRIPAAFESAMHEIRQRQQFRESLANQVKCLERKLQEMRAEEEERRKGFIQTSGVHLPLELDLGLMGFELPKFELRLPVVDPHIPFSAAWGRSEQEQQERGGEEVDREGEGECQQLEEKNEREREICFLGEKGRADEGDSSRQTGRADRAEGDAGGEEGPLSPLSSLSVFGEGAGVGAEVKDRELAEGEAERAAGEDAQEAGSVEESGRTAQVG